LLRWSPGVSTDASCLNDRKPENSVRTVTFCFLIVLLLHGVGVGQGWVRAVFSSEQEKMSNVRKKFLQCLC
jgi:hypothetical protein